MKDKNSILTARDEDMIFLVKGKMLVFHRCLYNKLVSLRVFKTKHMTFSVVPGEYNKALSCPF